MRNPALHLVGIAASPGVGGVFGTRAEEELRLWLEQRLDALGIDPVAYSRFVLSLLRHPDSALTPPLDVASTGRNGGSGRRSKARSRSKLPLQGDREQRRVVVQCLTSAADQKCGVETLVDELCAKLRDLEGGDSKHEQDELKTATDVEAKISLEALTPRDRVLRYYAAFPALQPTTPKKFPYRKERNLSNNNNNNNNNNYYYNNYNINNKKNSGIGNSNSKNNNNRARQKKNKISIHTESQMSKEKEVYEFAKLMEHEREKEEELALDQLRLAQLQAKFDQSLEALWDTGSGNSQGTDSIWAAPSLSIPSRPSWPTDNVDVSFTVITEKNTEKSLLNQESHIDNSPLIPLDVDLFSIEDYGDEFRNKDNKIESNTSWSGSTGDGIWCWGGLSNFATLGHSPHTGNCFFPVVSCNSPVTIVKESCLQQKVICIPEPDEDLLTSTRTHFRPIKEDGHWADGTTFPVNNTIERVTYRRSESGNLLYLPGGESPYMEYRESLNTPLAVPSNLTLKFRVRQCDKSIQTEPLRSPVKRRILSEKDRLYFSPNVTEEAHMIDNDEIEKDSFNLEQGGWNQPIMLLRNERKRRHSSSFKSRPLTVLRPLTL